MIKYISIITLLAASGCSVTKKTINLDPNALKPAVVTEKVVFDTDDPAIWINPQDPAASLIIGTDKETGGGIYAFDLQGKIVSKMTGMQRPNNVDIVPGFKLNGQPVDLAIATERGANALRVLRLPQLIAVDRGGLAVFVNETERQPMGVATYTNPKDLKSYVIVGRKSGPADNYLFQYELIDSAGQVALRFVRSFGRYSGKKEIEAIAVDAELGFVYYSDEQFGIRKYYADPAMGNQEIGLFGQGEYLEDNEGISIYKTGSTTGYILVSDQSRNRFNVYHREGQPGNPHQHKMITSIPFSTLASDGSEVTNVALPGFPKGLFVAMSDDKTFQYYRWEDIEKKILEALNK